MARMIPELEPAAISNKGEREVYMLLRQQLPGDWVVRHHFPACWMDRYFLRDAEADFVVLAPKKGLMLLEVKSSRGLGCKDGQWYRVNGDESRSPVDSPFEQAMGTKHRLVERIARKVFHQSKDGFPGVFGHAVVYPFGRAETLPHSSAEPHLFWGYNDRLNLRERLDQAFAAWGAGRSSDLFDGAVFDRVVSFLEDDARFVPVLAAEVDEQNEAIDALTREQYEAFRAALSTPRAHIRGTAGSGKTILALWTAENLSRTKVPDSRGGEKQQDVLLLCFNRNLAKWLQLKRPLDSRVEVASFFSLCRRITKQAGLPFAGEADDEFWAQKAAQFFCQAIDLLGDRHKKYDVILVDEAQDFHSGWWFPVQLMLKDPDNGGLILFSDPKQRPIYNQGEEAYPGRLSPHLLKHNCRNTKKVVSYCSEIIGEEIGQFPATPEGEHPQILPIESAPLRRRQLLEDLVRNLRNEGATLDRIAILSPWNADNVLCSLHNCDKLCNVSIARYDGALQDWKDGKSLWFCTIKSFKGLEADFVIVTDLIAPNERTFTKNDLYVAASRCKNRLYLIPSDHAAAQALREFIPGIL